MQIINWLSFPVNTWSWDWHTIWFIIWRGIWHAHGNRSSWPTTTRLCLTLPLITNAMSDRRSLLKKHSFKCCFVASLTNVAMLGFRMASPFRIFSHIFFSEGKWKTSLAYSNWARRSSGTSPSGNWGLPGNQKVHQLPCVWNPVTEYRSKCTYVIKPENQANLGCTHVLLISKLRSCMAYHYCGKSYIPMSHVVLSTG